LRARLADREESLALGVDPAALAARADRRPGAGRGTAAVAGLAGRLLGNRHRDLRALHRLLEGQPDLGLEVAPAHRLGTATPAAPEDRREDVADVGAAAEPGRPAAGPAAAEAAEDAARVVLLALLG